MLLPEARPIGTAPLKDDRKSRGTHLKATRDPVADGNARQPATPHRQTSPARPEDHAAAAERALCRRQV